MILAYLVTTDSIILNIKRGLFESPRKLRINTMNKVVVSMYEVLKLGRSTCLMRFVVCGYNG